MDPLFISRSLLVVGYTELHNESDAIDGQQGDTDVPELDQIRADRFEKHWNQPRENADHKRDKTDVRCIYIVFTAVSKHGHTGDYRDE